MDWVSTEGWVDVMWLGAEVSLPLQIDFICNGDLQSRISSNCGLPIAITLTFFPSGNPIHHDSSRSAKSLPSGRTSSSLGDLADNQTIRCAELKGQSQVPGCLTLSPIKVTLQAKSQKSILKNISHSSIHSNFISKISTFHHQISHLGGASKDQKATSL